MLQQGIKNILLLGRGCCKLGHHPGCDKGENREVTGPHRRQNLSANSGRALPSRNQIGQRSVTSGLAAHLSGNVRVQGKRDTQWRRSKPPCPTRLGKEWGGGDVVRDESARPNDPVGDGAASLSNVPIIRSAQTISVTFRTRKTIARLSRRMEAAGAVDKASSGNNSGLRQHHQPRRYK